MPNDCWNHITFSADGADLEGFIEELEKFEGEPEWVVDIMQRGQGAIYVKIWSAWLPDFTWLEELLEKYPNCWIKNEWVEEGGKTGVWVGTARSGSVVIKQLEWDDMSLEEEFERFREVV